MTIVQRTPSLGVGIRMQRLPGATAAAPAAPPPASLDAKVALMVGYQDGVAGGARVGWRQRLYYPVMDGWCLIDGVVELNSETEGYFRAVVVGVSPGGPIAWTWTLTRPDAEGLFWDGVEVDQQDGTLGIYVASGSYAGEDYLEAQIVCIATSAGVEVGSVTLRPCFNLDARPEEGE